MTACFSGTILRVNLTKGEVYKQKLAEEVALNFLGGKGFGAYFLYNGLSPKIDPLSPENLIIISTGPLTGTGAFSPKCNFVCKSPITGGWLDCTLGGFWGPELKSAGYDTVIIEGKAPDPVFLWIHDEKVEIKMASHLWGKNSHETERTIKGALGDSKIRVTSIGPAGENLVRFACVNGDMYRQAGRGGIGAVWGSKNLKAIAVRGSKKIGLADRSDFIKQTRELNRYLKNNCAPLDSDGTMF